jgi:PTH1 family peptidyl-tRNA hydrolase
MTRHNIGFLVLDALADRNGLRFRRSWRFPAQIAKGRVGDQDVMLVKPRTFMNRSGLAIGPLIRKGCGVAQDVVTVFDDVAMEWGRMRIRSRGSAGGHNGVQSLIDVLGSGAFSRIRVGIGLKPDKVSLADYVLAPFSDDERRELDDVIQRAADAVEMVCLQGAERAMNHFN